MYLHSRSKLTLHLLYVRLCENVWTDCIQIGHKIIQHMIHTWQNFLFNLSTNELKIIANKNISP